MKIDHSSTIFGQANTKRTELKDEIAKAALLVMADRGIQGTTFRDVAKISEYSLGKVQHYFEDRNHLLEYSIRLFKAKFVERLKTQLLSEPAKDNQFIEILVDSLRSDLGAHRVWYDLRNLALFNSELNAMVNQIESSLIDVIGEFAKRISYEGDVTLLYTSIDGLFRYQLGRIGLSTISHDELISEYKHLLENIMPK